MTNDELAAQLRLAADILEGKNAEQKPDPYAELKKAHAEGKVIQMLIRGAWIDCNSPTFSYPLDTYRIKPDEIPWIEWNGGECPLKDEEVEEFEFKRRDGVIIGSYSSFPPSTRIWTPNECCAYSLEIIAYRVLKWRKKKPKKTVPLGPEDILPGSVIRHRGWRTFDFRLVEPISTGLLMVSAVEDKMISFIELNQVCWQINRSISLTGKWNPDAWEPCSKEVDA